jgi:hypothetical protein
MVVRALAIVVIFLAVGLAGCVANETDDTAIVGSTEGLELAAGKGAISGLLIDDRYRPIELTDTASSEYQREGFILLQETGEQIQTDENGEFGFLDLDPGMYTLRAQIDGHEAKPQKVRVSEGVFEEIDISARRLVINTGAIVTEHYAAFMDCGIFFVAYSANPGCIPDTSGDTDRFDFFVDYSQYSTITWLVAETLFNNAPNNGEQLDVVIRRTLGEDFTSGVIKSGTYIKLHLKINETSPDPDVAGDEWLVWMNEGEMQMAIFGGGSFGEEIGDAYEPVYEAAGKDLPSLGSTSMRRGAGFMLGVKANFLNSAFLGEPETDPLQYCQLCS